MKTKKILLGIGGFVGFVIVLALVLTHGIADTARSQLNAIRSGDIAKAYGYTSKTFQHETSYDHFKKFVETHEAFKNNDDISFSTMETKDDRGILKGELKSKDGKKIPIAYKLVREKDEWKIEGIKLDLGKKEETSTTPQARGSVNGILVSDAADGNGFVETHKSVLRGKPAKIFATVQVAQATAGTSVVAELTDLSGKGSRTTVENKIDANGNVLKAFSFTSAADYWPSGEYKIKATLSTGDSKEVTVAVKEEDASATTQSQDRIHDVLVNDATDGSGYVETHKSALKEKPEKIYATVQVAQATAGTAVAAELTYLSGKGSLKTAENKITVDGNVAKPFSFTSTAGYWPSGEYKIRATLSTGDSKEVIVSVK